MNERMHHAAVLHFMNPVRPTDWLSQDRDEFITERNFSKVPISCNVLLSVTNNTFFFYDFFSCFFFFLAEKRTSKQNLCLHIVFFFRLNITVQYKRIQKNIKNKNIKKPKPNMVYILVKPARFVSLSAILLLCNGTHETSLKIVEHWPKKTVFFFLFKLLLFKVILFIFARTKWIKKKIQENNKIFRTKKWWNKKNIIENRRMKKREFRS